MLLRNETADIVQDEFAREMNHLVYEEARRSCEGFEMDDPGQLYHDCTMKEQEEIWICHYEEAKKHLNVDKLWSAFEQQIRKKLDVYLEDSWLKYLLHLVKADDTIAHLKYRTLNESKTKKWLLFIKNLKSVQNQNSIFSAFPQHKHLSPRVNGLSIIPLVIIYRFKPA